MNILKTERNKLLFWGSAISLCGVFIVWSVDAYFKTEHISETRLLQFVTENTLDLSKIQSAKNTVIISNIPQTFVVDVELGDTLADILQEKKIPKNQALNIIDVLSKYVNPKKIRVNEKISLVVKGNPDGTTELLRLSLAKDKRHQIEVIKNQHGRYEAKLLEKVLKQITECVHVPIKGSLYTDAQKKNIPYSVIRQLISAYSYDIDFQRDIKSGDSFSVYYESSLDPDTGEEHISNLLYANLKINGKNRPIYAYEMDGNNAFYYADGQSVKKEFMSTPINGGRISSGYGLRIHPIHGYTKLHKGLDFAAPRGTPVVAAANGTVVKACWYGSYGHYIEVKHSNGYSTVYAHLSGYAKHIRPGVRVTQGKTIGYVGSTGSSTGPHLHFELKKDGIQINPRSKSLHHSTEKLLGKDLIHFRKIREEIDSKVNLHLNKVEL